MKIKTTEICSFIFIIMNSCVFAFIINSSLKLFNTNAWILPIIGGLIGFIILLLYLYLNNYNKNMNINELNISLFGNKIGKLLNVIIIITMTIYLTILFWTLTNFISSQFLYNTPNIIIEFAFIFLIIYILKNGINSFFRTIVIILYILIFLYLVIGGGLIRQIDIKNIMPFFDFKLTNFILGIFNYISYSILPIFSILIIKKNNIENKNIDKKIIITYFISTLSIAFILFIIISVFGINLCNLYQFPAYHILKRVFEGAIIERFENILIFYWLLIISMSTIIISYYISKSLEDNFKINKIKYPFLIIILFCSTYLFKNSTIAKDFNESIFPIILYIGLLVIPIITFVKCKLMSKMFK